MPYTGIVAIHRDLPSNLGYRARIREKQAASFGREGNNIFVFLVIPETAIIQDLIPVTVVFHTAGGNLQPTVRAPKHSPPKLRVPYSRVKVFPTRFSLAEILAQDGRMAAPA